MKRLVGALLFCASTALGQSNGWQEIQNGWGEIQTATGGSSTPATCLVAGQVPFLLSPTTLGLGCDAGLTYDAGTDTLTSGRILVGDGSAAAPSLSFVNYPLDGFANSGSGISIITNGAARGFFLGGNLYLTQSFNKGLIVGESSDAGIWGTGTAAWAVGNGTAGDFSGSLKLNNTIRATAEGATWTSGSVSELTTIAAAATTDTTIDLPANAVIRAVVGKVTVAPPGTTSMTVGDPTTPARFATGISTALNTTFVGLIHVDQAGAAGPKQTTAAKVRYTPDGTPSDATGRIRTTIFYDIFVPPST